MFSPQSATLSELQRMLDVSSDVFRAESPYYQCQAHRVETLISVNFENRVESIPRTIEEAHDPNMNWEADHILELQMISGALNLGGYKAEQWDSNDVDAIISIANAKLNMQYILSDLNSEKKTIITELLKQIKASPTRQCAPFDEDAGRNPKLQDYLRTQAYIQYKCYGFIKTAIAINPYLARPRRPHPNPATPLPDIVDIASEILRCLRIDQRTEQGCLVEQS